MKCPLYTEFTRDNYGDFYDNSPDCLKEECAWWSNNSQQCVLPRLAGELYSLVEVMEELRDAIREEKQV